MSWNPSTSLKLPIVLVIIISLLSQNDVVASSPTLMETICIPEAGNYTTGGTYHKNLAKALAGLTAANATFSNTTAGAEGPDAVSALFYCTGTATAEECGACVEAASSEVVEKCPRSKEANVWYVECTLRYANRVIVGVEEEVPWGWLTSTNNFSDYVKLASVLPNTTVEVSERAALNTSSDPPGYAIKEVALSSTETLVGLAQCAPGVTGPYCLQCLSKATSYLAGCCNLFSYTNLIFLPSCRLLLSIQTSNSTTSTAPSLAPDSSASPPSLIPDIPTSTHPPPPLDEPSTATAMAPSSKTGALGSHGKMLRWSDGIIFAAISLTFLITCLPGIL